MSFLSRCCSNCIAFCIRHSVTYSSGVCPSSSLKRAANAERDMPAASVRDSTVQGFRRVCGEQGGVALIRTHLAQRTGGQEYPGERAEPGADRHTDAGPSSHRGGEADVRIRDPAGKDGSSRGNCGGRAVSCFGRFELRERGGVVRRRRLVGHLKSADLAECMIAKALIEIRLATKSRPGLRYCIWVSRLCGLNVAPLVRQN